MGLELALVLVSSGCSVALCDLSEGRLTAARGKCLAAVSSPSVAVTTHICDVSDAMAVNDFARSVASSHSSLGQFSRTGHPRHRTPDNGHQRALGTFWVQGNAIACGDPLVRAADSRHQKLTRATSKPLVPVGQAPRSSKNPLEPLEGHALGSTGFHQEASETTVATNAAVNTGIPLEPLGTSRTRRQKDTRKHQETPGNTRNPQDPAGNL